MIIIDWMIWTELVPEFIAPSYDYANYYVTVVNRLFSNFISITHKNIIHIVIVLPASQQGTELEGREWKEVFSID